MWLPDNRVRMEYKSGHEWAHANTHATTTTTTTKRLLLLLLLPLLLRKTYRIDT